MRRRLSSGSSTGPFESATGESRGKMGKHVRGPRHRKIDRRPQTKAAAEGYEKTVAPVERKASKQQMTHTGKSTIAKRLKDAKL